MRTPRVIPLLPVDLTLGGSAEVSIPEQPYPYRLKAVCGVLSLPGEDVAARKASVIAHFNAAATGVLTVTSDTVSTVTYAFDTVDPGGVVWIDTTGFVDGEDMLDGLMASSFAATFPASTRDGLETLTIRSATVGVSSSIACTTDMGAPLTFTPVSGEAFGLPDMSVAVYVQFKAANIAVVSKVFSPSLVGRDNTDPQADQVQRFTFAVDLELATAFDPLNSTADIYATIATARLPSGFIIDQSFDVSVGVLTMSGNFSPESYWGGTLSELYASIEDVEESWD